MLSSGTVTLFASRLGGSDEDLWVAESECKVKDWNGQGYALLLSEANMTVAEGAGYGEHCPRDGAA